MDEAISNLSLKCNASDSGSALYLLSAPAVEMNMDIVKELGDYLRELAPNAVIRYGDYPRKQRTLRTTVIMSQLSDVTKIRAYYRNLPDLIAENERRREDSETKLKELIDAATAVPSIL
jgi:hypothetical protein